MKKNQLFVCGTLLVSLTLAGGYSANAEQSYDVDGSGNSRATADGTITFSGDDDDTVPSPDNPEVPVKPDKPNPEPGDLKIVYVPNFDFGTQKKNSYGVEAMAKTVEVTKEDSSKVQAIPFVTTKDMRTDRGKGWVLSCKAGTFTNKDNASKTIPSAYVTLDKAHYAGDTSSNAGTGVYPLVSNTTSIKLATGTTTEVASASTTKNAGQGLGLYSLGFGEATTALDANNQSVSVSDGVKFHLPANTAVDDTTYTANFVWTLTPSI